MSVLPYILLLIFTVLYASIFGGRTGKAGSAIILTTVGLSHALVAVSPSMTWLAPRMLAVDVFALGLKLSLAFASNRKWPIYFAAFQLNTVCACIAILLSDSFRDSFYRALATAWAAPALLVMIYGTYLDHASDVKRPAKRDWSEDDEKQSSSIFPDS